VDVITMSIGGPSSDPTIAAAIANHKDSILFVASAGNRGPSTGSIEYPAWDPNVVAVTAIDDSEIVMNFSSRGIDDGNDSVITIGEIEFAAAWSLVESTFPTYFTEVDGYEYHLGTSMAASQVAGLAAKLWQGDPDSTRLFLRTTVTDIVDGKRAGAGYDVASGYGLPHVTAAAPPPPPPPAELDSLHVRDIDGDGKKSRRGKWQANVTVMLHDFDEHKVRRAEVEATWTTSKGTSTAKCRIKRGGTCKFRSPSFGKGVSNVTFSVTDISHNSLTYSVGDNHDPDEDSDGTTLVIDKP
jgi:subtilisin family serine protease